MSTLVVARAILGVMSSDWHRPGTAGPVGGLECGAPDSPAPRPLASTPVGRPTLSRTLGTLVPRPVTVPTAR